MYTSLKSFRLLSEFSHFLLKDNGVDVYLVALKKVSVSFRSSLISYALI